ncbi:DegT/DnrJ/EryC1/StrS family aminotransferase [Rheinheimera sp. FR7-31]|uniref:DegT/DnrJ/EryC1/StrS family aminotransferase n=1 Tax=Rheinheimera fenheensis TaxID=3152295 RepID=UPI00325F45CD
MDVKFAPVMANAADFPEAIIRATPGFGFRDIGLLWQKLQLGQCTYTRNGRAAIAIAAQQLKFPNQTNTVLLPAYHCPALVEPFLWLGYQVRFYPVQADLSVDADVFQRLLTADVSHCVVVQFFGFKQNANHLIELAHAAGKRVLEDCAHGLVDFVASLQQDDPRVSARICSINKLLPTIDGGLLYLRQQQSRQPGYCSWLEELKGIAFLLKIPQRLERFRQRAKTRKSVAVSVQGATTEFKYFKPADLNSASFRHTKWILQYSNLEAIKAKRRANYRYLVAGLTGVAAGSCLYPVIADEAPYVLPFLLRDGRHFQHLRQQKIQVLRWEEMAPSGCDITEQYRSRLIQLPCHHKLTRAELDYIIQAMAGLTEL